MARRLTWGHPGLMVRAKPRDDGAHDLQGVVVVHRHVIHHAGAAAVGVGPAEFGGGDHFAGGGLHQGRAGQEDGALALARRTPAHDHRLVAHGRHIGAAGGGQAHDAGDLGDALGAHVRLVVEDAAEVVPVWENLRLVRQVGAAAVHQVDAGQAVLQRDLLGAQVLLDRHGKVDAALHRGVVGHDHHLAAGHPADAGDQPSAGGLAVVQAMGGERRHLQKRRAGIKQARSTRVPRQAACHAR